MMTLPKVLLLTAVILVSSIAIAYCQEHGHTHRELYVKSTPTQECPQHHQCHTLLSYLQDWTASFTSNTTLHFLPGNHSAAVPQPMILVISNISNLALIGPEVGPDEPPVAHIFCNYTMQFQFINASNVSLKGLEIQECGAYNQIVPISLQCVATESTMPSAILFESADSIAVENIHILYSFGFGLVVWNCFGNVSIYNSDFSYNGWKNFSSNVSIGGNALFYYKLNKLPIKLEVVSSIFGYGHGADCSMLYHEHSIVSGGLSIVVDSEVGLSDITITVSDSIFRNNQAVSGANMMVSVKYSRQLPHVYLSILNSSFINGTALKYGGGLHLDSLYRSIILNSKFLENSVEDSDGGGLYIYICIPKGDYYSDVVYGITGSIFSGNSAGNFGGGLYASSCSLVPLSFPEIYISNSTLSVNRAEINGGGMYFQKMETILTLF